MRYDWLVDVIVTVHFAYLVYVVLGGFLAWRWPKAFWAHLAAGIWGVAIVFEWVDCPLTWAEHWARERAGEAPSDVGFIERYVTGIIYPEQYVTQVQLAVAAVALFSWAGAFVLWRRRAHRAAGEPGGDTHNGGAESGGRAASV